MTVRCAEFVDRLTRAAELPSDDGIDQALARHLQTCAACRGALDDQRQIRALLTARPVLEASPAFRVRVREAIDRERTVTGVIDFRRWTWRLVPIAAAVALATALGVPQMSTGSSSETSGLEDLPVSAVLYANDVSDTSALTLMLRANADGPLASYVEPTAR